MSRVCGNSEVEQNHSVISDGALAYKGVIPEDCWAEPYMSRNELQHEMDAGVVFCGYEESHTLCDVALDQQ